MSDGIVTININRNKAKEMLITISKDLLCFVPSNNNSLGETGTCVFLQVPYN